MSQKLNIVFVITIVFAQSCKMESDQFESKFDDHGYYKQEYLDEKELKEIR
jgi:hypothetical protein